MSNDTKGRRRVKRVVWYYSTSHIRKAGPFLSQLAAWNATIEIGKDYPVKGAFVWCAEENP